jgi:hypothetical protein
MNRVSERNEVHHCLVLNKEQRPADLEAASRVVWRRRLDGYDFEGRVSVRRHRSNGGNILPFRPVRPLLRSHGRDGANHQTYSADNGSYPTCSVERDHPGLRLTSIIFSLAWI